MRISEGYRDDGTPMLLVLLTPEDLTTLASGDAAFELRTTRVDLRVIASPSDLVSVGMLLEARAMGSTLDVHEPARVPLDGYAEGAHEHV